MENWQRWRNQCSISQPAYFNWDYKLFWLAFYFFAWNVWEHSKITIKLNNKYYRWRCHFENVDNRLKWRWRYITITLTSYTRFLGLSQVYKMGLPEFQVELPNLHARQGNKKLEICVCKIQVMPPCPKPVLTPWPILTHDPQHIQSILETNVWNVKVKIAVILIKMINFFLFCVQKTHAQLQYAFNSCAKFQNET